MNISDIIQSEIPVLAKFSTFWCPPCKTLQPILEQNQSERSDYKTVYIDVEQHPSAAKEFNITSVPTLILFRGGKSVARVNGMMSKTQLNNWIDAHIG